MEDDPFRLDKLKSGEVVVIETADAPSRLHDFIERLGIARNLRTCCEEPGGMRCWIDVVRSRRNPDHPFSDTSLGLVRELLPHLERALRLYATLKRQETEKSIYQGMVDHFVLGCVLLNDAAEVIHTNRIAEFIIEQWPEVSIVRNRVLLSDRVSQRAFDAAIGDIIEARSRGVVVHEGKLVRLGKLQGKLLGLLVYPAPLLHYYQGGQAPSAIAYLSDLTGSLESLKPSNALSVARVTQLFSLTRQESTLAMLLACGHTIVEAAIEMNIAEASARNYSKRIYAKMGIGSQADLVRLILRSLSFLR